MRNLLLGVMACIALAGVASVSYGAPARSLLDEGKACSGGTDGKACKVGLSCHTPPGVCRSEPQTKGVCKATPDFCSNDIQPICGCDGKTYDNACLAEIEGVSVAAEGACKAPAPSTGQ